MEVKNNGLDVVISFDTTGSMFPVLAQVRNQVEQFVKELFATVGDLRVGIIAHGDYCDANNPYTIRGMDLTRDEKELCEFIRETKCTNGGDADECYELVMRTARTEMSWEKYPEERQQIFIMIGDASPHGIYYAANTQRIDWVKEAYALNEDGIKVITVHALAEHRRSSKQFYTQVAQVTEGTYLTLDNFSEITQLIMATCIYNKDADKIDRYVTLIRDSGRFTRSFAQNMERITHKSYVDKLVTVQSEGLVPVKAGRFQIMSVDADCTIKEFVEHNGITFHKGRGFYELTKYETVQQYKEIIMQDRETGEYFTGAQVRKRLGLQPQVEKGGVNEKLSSRDTEAFRVFVQSTSSNRKLIGGTMFLYEVSDLDSTDTAKEAHIKADKPKVTKESSAVATKEPKARATKKEEEAKSKREKQIKDVEEEIRKLDALLKIQKNCLKSLKSAK